MADEAQKKAKRPTAEKRIIQSEKRNLRNKVLKSRVRTSIRALDAAVSAKEVPQAVESLKQVYSLIDKGVKIGIYKKNKAARTKSACSYPVFFPTTGGKNRASL